MVAQKTIKKENLKFLLTTTDTFVDHIEIGDEVAIECEINCNGGILTSVDSHMSLDDLPFPFVNPLTGPIEVKGAKAGQVLRVTIKAMDLDELGYTGFRSDSGLFQNWICDQASETHRFKPMRIVDHLIHWDERRTIPAKPMVGVLGVAPAVGSILSIDNGEHGGNLDVQEIGPGCTVYLPINADGAYLYIGDCHARQGDGEVAGMGPIEVGARVTISVDVMERPSRMLFPRFENDTHIGTIGLGRAMEDAMRISYKEMIYWIADEYGFTEQDAYMLLSSASESRATQVVNSKITYVCKVEKSLIA
jgi:amidase